MCSGLPHKITGDMTPGSDTVNRIATFCSYSSKFPNISMKVMKKPKNKTQNPFKFIFIIPKVHIPHIPLKRQTNKS
jgi:hypothetical protein